MKKLCLTVIMLVIPAICVAASKKDSGSKELNKYLHELAIAVQNGSITKQQIKAHIEKKFGVKPVAYNLMQKRKLGFGERYLVGLLHKGTDVKVAKILNRQRKGKRSWRDVIYYYGATPEELNDMCQADAKQWNKELRKRKKASPRIAKASRARTRQSVRKGTMAMGNEVCQCQCTPR